MVDSQWFMTDYILWCHNITNILCNTVVSLPYDLSPSRNSLVSYNWPNRSQSPNEMVESDCSMPTNFKHGCHVDLWDCNHCKNHVHFTRRGYFTVSFITTIFNAGAVEGGKCNMRMHLTKEATSVRTSLSIVWCQYTALIEGIMDQAHKP